MTTSPINPKDFPILAKKIHKKKLVYLDNAASSQKPTAVLDAMREYYTQHYANVHRGVHQLSDESTQAWESAREQIAAFFGASQTELIMVRNTTEAINGVAYGWGDHNLSKGDVVLTTMLEHHANFVVWQELCKRTGAQFEVVPVTDDGAIDMQAFEDRIKEFADKLKLVAAVHVSNTTGAVLDVTRLMAMVHKHTSNDQVRVFIDGAQAAPHMPVDFHELGVDFYGVSGHKMLGPMGSGVLLVREELLKNEEMKPWLFGGGMIGEVYVDRTLYNQDIVERFTAGTPDVASAVGLGAACEYLNTINMTKVFEHDVELVQYAWQKLSQNKAVRLVGPEPQVNDGVPTRLGSVTFLMNKAHAHDVAQILDSEGIAVRSGHHCTMPLHTDQDWIATVRASFSVYTTKADIDALTQGIEKVQKVLGI